MNALENAIAVVAPGLALKRSRARIALQAVRAYEAASRGRRTDGWKTVSSSANSETRTGLLVSRNRARDLVRNNPYAARAVSIIASNLVGYGIKTTPQTANKKKSKPLLKFWNEWAESTDCDADGKHNMYGLQNLAGRTIPEAGEVLFRRVWKKNSKSKIPMQVQILEADYIDTHREGAYGLGSDNNGNVILQGKEFDKSGKLVAYWLFEQHPGEAIYTGRITNLSKRVPAEDIIHCYRVDRPGQVRGVTWLAPVVIRLRDFDEYEDAQLVRQKIAACFAAFVYDGEGAETTTPSGTPVTSDDLVDKFEPGMIERLGPGQDIRIATPPAVQGYSEYASVSLHSIAAGIGVPYESMTGDYSQVNFTSGRMGKADFHGLLDSWQWNMLVPQMCEGIFQWFIEAAELAGIQAAGATATYTMPRRTLTDPTKEIPAMIKGIRGGVETLFNAIRSMGYDPEEHLAEIKEGNDLLDSLGIIVDSDPRKITNGGQVQADPSAADPSGDDPAANDPKVKDKKKVAA